MHVAADHQIVINIKLFERLSQFGSRLQAPNCDGRLTSWVSIKVWRSTYGTIVDIHPMEEYLVFLDMLYTHTVYACCDLLLFDSGRYELLGDFNKILEKIILKLILVTNGCDISSEIAHRWTSLDLSDDKSTLVHVMTWCRQATSHYLNLFLPRSRPPYGVTRPQWDLMYLANCPWWTQ